MTNEEIVEIINLLMKLKSSPLELAKIEIKTEDSDDFPNL